GKAFAASAEGPRSEQLRVRGGGRVRSVDAKDGDVVTKGQVLVSFDDSVDPDEIATLKDRIATLQGSEYEGAKRQLAEAEEKLAALLSSGKSPPVTAPVAGTVSGLSVGVGDTLKNGALVGNVGEGGKASRLRATVDRSTRVKKG